MHGSIIHWIGGFLARLLFSQSWQTFLVWHLSCPYPFHHFLVLLLISLLENIGLMVKFGDRLGNSALVDISKIEVGAVRWSLSELKGRRIGVAVVCALCSIFSAALSYLCTIRGSYTISGDKFIQKMSRVKSVVLVVCQIMFSVIRTFTYAIHATACFLLFPNNLFGMIFGSMQLCNGFTSLTADPIFRLERIPWVNIWPNAWPTLDLSKQIKIYPIPIGWRLYICAHCTCHRMFFDDISTVCCSLL